MSPENAPINVVADCLIEVSNQVMKMMAEACGSRIDLMLSISGIIHHRCEMLYRTKYIRDYDQASEDIKREAEMKSNQEQPK